MRKALLPALLLLGVAGHAPDPQPVVIDSALVEHLRTIEDWAGRLEGWSDTPLSALTSRESEPPELIEHALDVYGPILSELDALWDDPVSREHLRSGALYRPEPGKLFGARVCMNVLAARAVRDAREGRRDESERGFDLLLAYSRSLGTDGIGFELGWAGESIARLALQRLACAGLRPDPRLANALGTRPVPFDLTRVVPDAGEHYARQAAETRELLALASR